MATAAEIGEALRKALARELKAIALDIDAELRRYTPVDTGHARRNWVPSVGQPFEGESADDATRAAGISEVLGYKLEDGQLWLANNTPYINVLNYGHSKQQPAGFIERAIAVALQKAEKRASGVIDVSAMRDAFARRHENADVGATPDAADTTSGGGEY